jgi:hypothetical protein
MNENVCYLINIYKNKMLELELLNLFLNIDLFMCV